MALTAVAEGSIFDLPALPGYESELAEGSKNMLRLDLRLPVTQGVADTLEDALRGAGVAGVRVTTASPVLKIYFTKGFPWLAVIAGIILASLVLAALIIGWALFTEIKGLIPLMALATIAVATVTGIYLITKPRGKT